MGVILEVDGSIGRSGRGLERGYVVGDFGVAYVTAESGIANADAKWYQPVQTEIPHPSA